MPVFVFTTTNGLTTHLQSVIAPNGTQAIDGQVHQDAMLTTVLSLLNIVNSLPGSTVNAFDPWNGGTTYTGGVEVVVKHDNKLWLFVSGSDNVGTEPGTDGLVWQEISAVQLAHFQNQDQYLDLGGPSEVSAAQLKRLIAQRLSWQPCVDAIAAFPAGGEPIGYVYAVDDSPADEFDGHAGERAELTITGWSFSPVNDGDSMRFRDYSAMLFRTLGAWSVIDLSTIGAIPSLSSILLDGDPTYGRMILSAALLRVETTVTHSSPGTRTLDYAAAGAYGVTLQADATMSWSNGAIGGEYFMRLSATGATRTVAWASNKWSVLSGITLPTSINSGETYHITFKGIGSRLCALTCGLVTDI